MGWKWWHWLVSPRRADMWDKLLPRNAVISTVKSDLGCGFCTDSAQSVSVPKFSRIELVTRLIDRRWALSSPDSPIHEVIISGNGSCRQSGGELWGSTFRCNPRPSFGDDLERKSRQHPSFYVVRDDLLHPLVNGNKARKLDAVLPLLEDNGITDVVTCGGCQSAHAAAVAISCAERGLKPHLLLRGEQPEILTGYNLISSLYGNVTYVERSLYARREDMLEGHANSIAGSNGSIECLDDLLVASFANNASKMKSFSEKASLQTITNLRKVAIINEGAADAVGLLASNAALSQVPGQIVLTISLGRIEGAIRLVHYLSQKHLFGKDQVVKIVVDAGTGTTAVGLALGALCLGLPWEVSAVMLADTLERYRKREECLISKFFKICNSPSVDLNLDGANDKLVHWLHRNSPRKFGNILKGEVEECQKIAQKTGILVDPVYTLAAWQLSTQLSLELGEDEKVVMLHTGGTLGMFGLAQRYKPYFQNLKAEVCD